VASPSANKAMTIVRASFLAGAVGFGWWWLREDWSDAVQALGDVDAWQLLGSLAVVLIGLLVTGVVWLRILAGYGYFLPTRLAFRVFFVGQLGKYIPGSVWSLAAQADMARAARVPARTTVATGLVLIYWMAATATALGALAVASSQVAIQVPTWIASAVAALALAGLVPVVVGRIARGIAGTAQPHRVTWRECILLAVAMLLTWMACGTAMLLVVPTNTGTSSSAVSLIAATAAFAVAFVAGVLVPFAPAGFGIREGVLILLLTPQVGLATATAVALLTRVVHTTADFSIAGMSWLAGRGMAAT